MYYSRRKMTQSKVVLLACLMAICFLIQASDAEKQLRRVLGNSISPTLSPTGSVPTKSPSLSAPTKAPTWSIPTKSPSVSKPTLSPRTSKPSRSPTVSRPTPSPTPPTFKPTLSPTTARPTHSPTTSRPTRSPSTPRPTKSPVIRPCSYFTTQGLCSIALGSCQWVTSKICLGKKCTTYNYGCQSAGAPFCSYKRGNAKMRSMQCLTNSACLWSGSKKACSLNALASQPSSSPTSSPSTPTPTVLKWWTSNPTLTPSVPTSAPAPGVTRQPTLATHQPSFATGQPTTGKPSVATGTPTAPVTTRPTFKVTRSPTRKPTRPTRHPTYPPSTYPPTDPVGNASCYNGCFFAHDGVCDDGGPGSADGFCYIGSDCADCGPR